MEFAVDYNKNYKGNVRDAEQWRIWIAFLGLSLFIFKRTLLEKDNTAERKAVAKKYVL
jgi:hypothetical protein